MANEAKLFEKDLGTWDAEVEVVVQPGADVQRSRGVSVNKLVGGTWLVTDFKNETGFEGHGIYGWDAAKQRYVGTWVDTMRGSLVITDGEWNAETRTMTYRGELAHGDRTFRWREVTRAVDRDTQTFSSYVELAPGTEHEMMRVTYRRRA